MSDSLHRVCMVPYKGFGNWPGQVRFGVYIGPYLTDDTLCILSVNGLYVLYIGYTSCKRPVQGVYFVCTISCIHLPFINPLTARTVSDLCISYARTFTRS